MEIIDPDKKAIDWLNKKNELPALIRGIFVVLIFLGVIAIFVFSQQFYDFTKNIYDGNQNYNENNEDSESEYASESLFNADCNVVAVNLHGTLLTYIPEHNENDTFFDYDVTSSEYANAIIQEANDDEKIKAIMIEVDSAGGSPVAGEEISNAIKNSEKPVVAFIREIGASASYWAISSADKIFASKNSNIGSIGITASYLNNVKKNQKDGYTLEELSVGKYKDSGSPDKVLTDDEKAVIFRDLNIVYKNFIQAVSENRNIPIEKVKSFADGSTVLGERALELRLIDEIGGLKEVKEYLKNTLGLKPELCWQ